MKRLFRNGIITGLVLCILIFVWVFRGNKGWIIMLLSFFSSTLNNISLSDKILIILTFIILLVAIRQLYLYQKSTHTASELISSKKSFVSVFEVKNIKILEKVITDLRFMENPVLGKFFNFNEKKTWQDIKKEVDFSKLQPPDFSNYYKIFVIKGKPGIGKTTYMLWSLDELFQRKYSMFNTIIFLNPNTHEQWNEDLSHYSSESTLLAIDALRRRGDSDEDFKERCSSLFALTTGEEIIEGKIIGPFKVFVTIRDDEYDYLLRYKEFEQIFESILAIEITPEVLNLKAITEKYLQSYGVRYENIANKEDEIIAKLKFKSEGTPFYIRHLIADLKVNNKRLSEEALEGYPKGMVNFIWQVIKKGYYIENDVSIPFILLLFSHRNKDISHFYLDFIGETLALEGHRKKVKTKINNLKKLCLIPSNSFFKSGTIFILDNHWNESLKIGMDQPEIIESPLIDLVNNYKQIEDEQYQRLKEVLANRLRNHLNKGFKDKADVFLCVDLAKMGEEYLDMATIIYCNFWLSSKLSIDYIEYVREELYNLWIKTAWKYRSKSYNNDEKVINCYENAFYNLGMKTHLKSGRNRSMLRSYSFYLQKNVLSNYKFGTQEFQLLKKKVENIYNEILTNEIEEGRENFVSYYKFALFYDSIQEHQKALNFYNKAKEICEVNKESAPTHYLYSVLAECYNKFALQESNDSNKFADYVVNSIDNYLLSAGIENTSLGYGAVRGHIKELKKDKRIREGGNQDLYLKCDNAILECSEKAYHLDPDNLLNCGDYGESLLHVKRYDIAKIILEKGIDITLQTNKLNEKEKKKYLSWFYEKIGYCYKHTNKIPEATELFNKSAEISNSAMIYSRLIDWLFQLNDYEKTVIAYIKFLELFSISKENGETIFPRMSYLLQAIAISYDMLQKDDEAAIFWKYYADVLFYLKDSKGCGFVGNKLLTKYQRFPEARDCFLKSIRLAPDFIQNKSQLGFINSRLQRWEECMICSLSAFSIRQDLRDKKIYELCQQENKLNSKVYDHKNIEDLLDLAVIEELCDRRGTAINYYSEALKILNEQQIEEVTKISIYKFIGDSFWALGNKDDALDVNKKLKDMVAGNEKLIAETIYWFMSTDMEIKKDIQSVK